MLLLDEATSSLDLETERQVHANLASLGCTRILIAHRLATVRDADRILVLQDGRIVQEGTFEELAIARGSLPVARRGQGARACLSSHGPSRPSCPVSGFDAVEAAWRLLRRHGRGGRPASLSGGARPARLRGGPRGTARAGRDPGTPGAHRGRRPRLPRRPDAVQLQGRQLGGARRSTRRDAVRVEGTGGSQAVPVAELAPFLSGYVLDLSASLPEGKGLFDRLRALVLQPAQDARAPVRSRASSSSRSGSWSPSSPARS